MLDRKIAYAFDLGLKTLNSENWSPVHEGSHTRNASQARKMLLEQQKRRYMEKTKRGTCSIERSMGNVVAQQICSLETISYAPQQKYALSNHAKPFGTSRRPLYNQNYSEVGIR